MTSLFLEFQLLQAKQEIRSPDNKMLATDSAQIRDTRDEMLKSVEEAQLNYILQVRNIANLYGEKYKEMIGDGKKA